LETAEALTRIGWYAAARTRTSVFSNASIESNALTMALSWPELARVARAPPKKARKMRALLQAKMLAMPTASFGETTAKLAAFPISINHPCQLR
jgi:hypothetical protein